MNIKPLFILSLLSFSVGARAQQHTAGDTVMKGATIEVLQSYKPQVKQAPKPEWVPQIPPHDTTHPVFSYDVPQQTLYYTYSSLPLKPLALGKDDQGLPFVNYVKVGAGNLSTIYLDAGIGSFSGDNYETAIHLHHISQAGSITNQKSALSGIEAEGTLHNDFSIWHATIEAERNQYNYYGEDILNNDLKQVYTTIRATVDTKNKMDSSDKLAYNPGITLSDYIGSLGTHEVTFGFNAPFVYKFDNTVDGLVTVKGAFAGTNMNGLVVNNNYGEILPGIGVHRGGLSGHALIGFALGMNSKGYVLPDIAATYKIPDTRFAVSAGWQSLLRQNTYEQLSSENPYISANYTTMQTRSDELFVNVAASVGDYLSFSGRLSWWNYNSLPTFLTDIGGAYSEGNRPFMVSYDNVNALSTQIAARYKVANTWTAGVTADFYNYYKGTQTHVWGEPEVRIKGDFTAMPFTKLTVSAYLAFLNGIYDHDLNNNSVSQKPVMDAGLNAEYQLIKRLSAFIQLNNLFNDKYQRWYGYEAYGLNIYGGVRLKF